MLQDAKLNYTEVVLIAKNRRFPDSLASVEVLQVAPDEDICVLTHVGRSEDNGEGYLQPMAEYTAKDSRSSPEFVCDGPKRRKKAKKDVELDIRYNVFRLPERSAIIERHVRGLDDYDVRIIICDQDISFEGGLRVSNFVDLPAKREVARRFSGRV